MIVESCLLFEWPGASWLNTSVGFFFGVNIDVLFKVLVLGKVFPTNFAYKSLEPQVRDNKMSAQALLGGELLAATFQGASLLALSFRCLNHLLKVSRYQLLVSQRKLFLGAVLFVIWLLLVEVLQNWVIFYQRVVYLEVLHSQVHLQRWFVRVHVRVRVVRLEEIHSSHVELLRLLVIPLSYFSKSLRLVQCLISITSCYLYRQGTHSCSVHAKRNEIHSFWLLNTRVE